MENLFVQLSSQYNKELAIKRTKLRVITMFVKQRILRYYKHWVTLYNDEKLQSALNKRPSSKQQIIWKPK
jgi:hypothetical protein